MRLEFVERVVGSGNYFKLKTLIERAWSESLIGQVF